MTDQSQAGSEGDIGYERTDAFQWTETAYEMLEQGKIQAQLFNTDGVVSAHLWGPCPRCRHDLDDRQTLTAAVPGLRREVPSAVQMPVDVGCGCSHKHPGAPQDRLGCGVRFRVYLQAEAGTP